MSDRRESLVKNTALFALGNLGSKILQVVMVPYYTRVMTSAQFGTTDILQAVVALLMPIFSLTIYEGVFRFAMERDYDREGVLTTGALVTTVGAAMLCIIGAFCCLIIPPIYVWLVVGNTVTVAFRSLFSQYARAVNRIRLFALDNILITVFVLVLNVVFITVLRWGVVGYILGYTFANLLSCLFLWLFLREDRRMSIRSLDGFLMQDMLLFSAPLIPNTICWWISGFVDRLLITARLGESVNGLYAAAHKLPSLLTVVVTVFFQAWQISANREFKKRDISQYYTEIHDQVFASVTVISSVLIWLCRPITAIFLGADYAGAWRYMPVLLLAMTFFSFAQFLGSVYSANMRTGMALVTNAVAVAVNLFLNLILIRHIGALGAGIATACSYLTLWIVRIKDTSRIVRIHYNKQRMFTATIVLIGQAVIMSVNLNTPVIFWGCAASTLVLVWLFRKTFIGLLKFAGRLLKKNV